MPAPNNKNFTNRPQYQLAMYWYNQGKADAGTGTPPPPQTLWEALVEIYHLIRGRKP